MSAIDRMIVIDCLAISDLDQLRRLSFDVLDLREEFCADYFEETFDYPVALTICLHFADNLPLLPRAQARTGCRHESHARGIIAL